MKLIAAVAEIEQYAKRQNPMMIGWLYLLQAMYIAPRDCTLLYTSQKYARNLLFINKKLLPSLLLIRRSSVRVTQGPPEIASQINDLALNDEAGQVPDFSLVPVWCQF